MDVVDHDDIQNLHQCHICLHRELEKFEEDSPEFKHGSQISKYTRKVVELSARIADKRVQGGARVSDPISKDSCMWLLFANMLLLIAMTVFIMNMWHSILDLEAKGCTTGRMFTEEVNNGKR